VDGDYAYVADDASGLAVIDISSPTNPGTPVYEDTTGNAYDVYVSGDYAYVADAFSGLAVIQVRERVDWEEPVITIAPSDFSAEQGYTGKSISWTAIDSNPDTYTIELQGTGLVAGPTVWASGAAINYNIPEGFGVGTYEYFVNFTDDYDNSIIDSVNFTVEVNANPVITISPENINAEFGYSGQSISWTATDTDPGTYTIELQGTGIVASPTVWTSGVAIIYNIPDGFGLGTFFYTVNFTDDYGNFITDSITFTVEDTTDPVITFSSNDITIEIGYSNLNISWTATDIFPGTYTIELIGSGIVIGPITWSSGSPIAYGIPDGFAPGVYKFNITLTDDSGNYASGTITVTITGGTPGGIPFGNTFLIITVLSIFGLILAKKRQIVSKSR